MLLCSHYLVYARDALVTYLVYLQILVLYHKIYMKKIKYFVYFFSMLPYFSRTIFIGDIHGCLEELEELISRLSITSQDRVIILGDLINK